jgi:hypothetical protein
LSGAGGALGWQDETERAKDAVENIFHETASFGGRQTS